MAEGGSCTPCLFGQQLAVLGKPGTAHCPTPCITAYVCPLVHWTLHCPPLAFCSAFFPALQPLVWTLRNVWTLLLRYFAKFSHFAKFCIFKEYFTKNSVFLSFKFKFTSVYSHYYVTDQFWLRIFSPFIAFKVLCTLHISWCTPLCFVLDCLPETRVFHLHSVSLCFSLPLFWALYLCLGVFNPTPRLALSAHI